MVQRRCPVCGMETEGSAIHARHAGLVYDFCSSQCRENFVARPSLYIGKQAGQRKAVIKRRHFVLDRAMNDAQRAHVIQAIERLMGVQHVHIENRRVSIDYNLLEARAEQIERALLEAGATLGSGWSERLKRGWIHYTEENELDHLASSEAACCNKPPARG